MTIREEVYKAIDSERDYQESRWNPQTTESCGQHSVAEFILYMEHYIQLARVEASTKADPESREAALEVVRKVGGLAVACMEQNGAPQREGFER
jgi:hypothetical protein